MITDDIIKAEVRRVLTEVPRSLTTREIAEECTVEVDMKDLARAIHDLHEAGQLIRASNAGGRYEYALRAGAPPPKSGESWVAREKGATTAPARAVEETPKRERPAPKAAPTPAPAAKVAAAPIAKAAPSPAAASSHEFTYRLHEHIDQMLGDLGDVLADAVDHDASSGVLRPLVSAMRELRRAHTAAMRGSATATGA